MRVLRIVVVQLLVFTVAGTGAPAQTSSSPEVRRMDSNRQAVEEQLIVEEINAAGELAVYRRSAATRASD